MRKEGDEQADEWCQDVLMSIRRVVSMVRRCLGWGAKSVCRYKVE